MPEAIPLNQLPSVFSPLAKALLDGFSEGVIVFDIEGRLLYANQQARAALAGMDLSEGAPDLGPRLAAIGGRLRPLRVGGLELGEAMFIPGVEGPTTLAAREKEAIVKTLDAHNWKLAETAGANGPKSPSCLPAGSRRSESPSRLLLSLQLSGGPAPGRARQGQAPGR